MVAKRARGDTTLRPQFSHIRHHRCCYVALQLWLYLVPDMGENNDEPWTPEALKLLEIIDVIAFHLEHPRDLLSFSLVARIFVDEVLKRHIKYRHVCAYEHNRKIWKELKLFPDRTRNVHTLSLSFSGKPISPSTRVANENAMVDAVRYMTGLSCLKITGNRFVRGDFGGLNKLLAEVCALGGLRTLEIKVFSLGIHDFEALCGLSNLVELYIRSNCGPSTVSPGLSRFLTGNLTLERLRLNFNLIPANALDLTDYLLSAQMPHLRSLSLSMYLTPASTLAMAPFIGAHPTIESLHLKFGGEELMPRLSPGSLPLLNELHCTGKMLEDITNCPINTPRAIRKIGGFRGSHSDLESLTFRFADLTAMREVEGVRFDSLMMLRNLAAKCPHLESMWGISISGYPKEDAGVEEFKLQCIDAISHFKYLRTFRGIQLFKDMELEGARRENENVLTRLISLVPTLHELDIWGDTDHAKKLIVVERKGAGFTASIAKESLSGEIRIASHFMHCHSPNIASVISPDGAIEYSSNAVMSAMGTP
ncbi:hypothetical protein BD410DRAFT_795766 [Rickenella mellea]|uniref:RNI-like protein n=1 Tax=Rickenella mellea TaxID=50990 RepID=A0A4Y7PLC9_9AGAM|nr:hypothetical protein BD410DRAFT_795766 [Rickenella mellea]